MEPNYYELGVYIFFLGMIVQSLFRIFDPIIDIIRDFLYRLFGKEPPYYDEIEVIRGENVFNPNNEKESVDTSFYSGEMPPPSPNSETPVGSESHHYHYHKKEESSNFYDHMFPAPYTPKEDRLKRRKMKVTWKDLIGPPIVGLLVAWLFLPHTVFDYLGFQPRYPIIAYIITSLLISRIANAEYDTFKTVGTFFVGIANRFKF